MVTKKSRRTIINSASTWKYWSAEAHVGEGISIEAFGFNVTTPSSPAMSRAQGKQYRPIMNIGSIAP